MEEKNKHLNVRYEYGHIIIFDDEGDEIVNIPSYEIVNAMQDDLRQLIREMAHDDAFKNNLAHEFDCSIYSFDQLAGKFDGMQAELHIAKDKVNTAEEMIKNYFNA